VGLFQASVSSFFFLGLFPFAVARLAWDGVGLVITDFPCVNSLNLSPSRCPGQSGLTVLSIVCEVFSAFASLCSLALSAVFNLEG
jgi:hypothetical protein